MIQMLLILPLKHDRRRLILTCGELTYLDQRPVKPRDRECAEAWSSGGLAAERALKERWAREEEERMHQQIRRMAE